MESTEEQAILLLLLDCGPTKQKGNEVGRRQWRCGFKLTVSLTGMSPSHIPLYQECLGFPAFPLITCRAMVTKRAGRTWADRCLRGILSSVRANQAFLLHAHLSAFTCWVASLMSGQVPPNSALLIIFHFISSPSRAESCEVPGEHWLECSLRS